MSVESVVERFASLYASSASYVLGPQGYRFWLDVAADIIGVVWPALVVVAVGALGFAGYRLVAAPQSPYRRARVSVGRVRRAIFRSSMLPGKRLPLVYEPGGFNRRRKDGRWR